jgi:hypothetical protein
VPRDPVNTARLLKLLRSKDAEEVAASALVLARLKPPAARTLKPMLRALMAAPEVTAPYILEAIASQRGPTVTRALIPLLAREGTVREQVTELLAQRRGVVALIAASARARSDLGAIIAVLERVNSPAAQRALFQMLPRADFVSARRVYGCVARLSESGSSHDRAQLARLARAAFARSARNATGRIAALKILVVLRDSHSERVLLAALKDRVPAVRRCAMDLARVCVGPRRKPKLSQALLSVIDGEKDTTLRASALGAMALGAEAALLLPRIPKLFAAPRNLVLALLDALPLIHERSSDAPTTHAVLGRGLLAGLKHRDPQVAAATGRLLAQHASLLPLAQAAGCERGALDAILRQHSAAPSAARFDWLAQSDLAPEHMLALAAADRERANAVATARARELLQTDRALEATAWLEPLVRGRQATLDARLALARVWMQLIPTEAGKALPRVMQLLGPLLRVEGFDVAAGLREAPVLNPAAAHVLAEHLRARGRPERALAAVLDSSPAP